MVFKINRILIFAKNNKLIKLYLIFLILNITTFQKLYAIELKNSIYIQISAPFTSNDDSFLNDYNTLIGGNKVVYHLTPAYSLIFKSNFQKGFRICLSLDYFTSYFNDNFTQKFKLIDKDYYRNVISEFSIKNFPILLNYESIPSDNIYRNYYGIGLGMNLSSIYWNETINSDFSNDIRKSTNPINESVIYPAIKLYSGVELGFDKKNKNEILGGINIEASILYTFRKYMVFKDLKKQFKNYPDSWNQSVSLDRFQILLTFGLSLNLYHNTNN